MPTEIKCPSCGNVFDVEDVIAADLDKKYQKDYQLKLNQSLEEMDTQKKELLESQRLFEEKKKKENELFAQKVAQERQKIEAELQEQLRRSISADFENQLRMLQQTNQDNEEKLKASRQKELSFLQKEQELKNKEAELEINVQKKLQEERAKLSEEIRKLEEQKGAAKETEHQLKVKELEKQLDDQKKLADEMRTQTQRQNELIASGALKLAADPRKTFVVPEPQSEVPFFNFAPLQNAAARLDAAAAALGKVDQSKLGAGKLDVLENALVVAEQKFLRQEGLPRRPWFRHLLHAPGYYTGYGVKTLPGVRAAMARGGSANRLHRAGHRRLR